MHSSVLETRLQKEDQNLRDGIATINKLLADSIERTKAIARGLLPVGLMEEGLILALKALTEAIQSSSGIPISINIDSQWQDDDKEQTLEIYRIMQEALHNSVRHSECNNIQIRLSDTLDSEGSFFFTAEVADDGKGITNKKPGNGMGLKIMQYRAEKTGGNLKIETGNNGTVVRYILPVLRGTV